MRPKIDAVQFSDHLGFSMKSFNLEPNSKVKNS